MSLEMDNRLIQGLRDLMASEFRNVQTQLNTLCQTVDRLAASVVSNERFQALCERVNELEANGDDREKRLTRVERVIWLLGIVGGLLLTVLGAFLIALMTGKVGITWR